MSSDITYCETCGAKTVAYKHSLTKKLVRPLYKLMRAGGGPANITDDLKLNGSEYTNFAKLRYWELVRKHGLEERGGNWVITELGRAFLEGRCEVRRRALVYRGEVIELFDDWVKVTDVTGGWQYRPKYLAESVPIDTVPIDLL